VFLSTILAALAGYDNILFKDPHWKTGSKESIGWVTGAVMGMLSKEVAPRRTIGA